MGGLSQALTAADAASKKRPLSLLPSLPSVSSADKEQLSQLRTRSALHHQLAEHQQKQQRLQRSGDSGSLSLPLSHLSATTPHSTGLTEFGALRSSGVSGQLSRRPRPLFTFSIGESDASDGEEFDISSVTASQLLSYVAPNSTCLPSSHLASSHGIPLRGSQHRGSLLDGQHGPSCPVSDEDYYSDETATAPVSYSSKRAALEALVCDDNETYSSSFRPGSVMEGAGRKLSGTEAMRVRNTVLRQTGFLEQHSNNMFTDHESS